MKILFSALKINITLALLLSLIAGCGSGGLTDPAPTPGGSSVPASIDLLVSSPQLNSDDASPVTLTALVKDSQNRAMADQKVYFTASSGILKNLSTGTGESEITDGSAITDAGGMATAQLSTSGNPTCRIINLTATVSGKSATNAVAVTGTNISIDPPTFSLPFNDPAGKQITVSLRDSAGTAILGKTVSIVSTSGNSSFIPSGPYTTDNCGQVQVTVTNATDTVKDTITATAIGISSKAILTINMAKLTVWVTAADTQIPINTEQAFTVTYTESDTAVSGERIYFTTTRGAITPSSCATDAAGTATVSVSSENSGPAVLTAYTMGTTPTSTQVSIIFVAKTATKMDFSAFPAIVNTNAAGRDSEKSLIKVVLRDDQDNLVMGKAVDFRIIQDASAGWLSKASAVTDMYGMATTNYVAGGAPSGLNNVIIRATVQDAPDVSRTTTLTVGDQDLFISLATGPEIGDGDAPNTYKKNYVALVTDVAGRPKEGAVVTATVTPRYYRKGYYDSSNGKSWEQVNTLTTSLATDPIDLACWNEDGITQNRLYDYNGVLDIGEDQNANSRLDPGNVASVTATVTDSSGHSTLSISYARDYAYWVNVKLEVRASLFGSTTSAVQYFTLPGAATDYSSLDQSPPGNPSPFGSNSTCYAALTVMHLSDTEIGLRWERSSDAVSYNIYRDPNNLGMKSLLANTINTSYEDKAVSAGTTYCYEIMQIDASGVVKPLSVEGNRVCVAPVSGGLFPPTGVMAVALSDTQIQVSWNDDGGTKYRVYQEGIYLDEYAVRSIVVGALDPNTQYCFEASSVGTDGTESGKSSTVCATTKLPMPEITVTHGAAGELIVRWTAVPGATSYKIYPSWKTPAAITQPATDVEYRDKSLTPGVWYCYSVSAVNVSGESAQSEPTCEEAP